MKKFRPKNSRNFTEQYKLRFKKCHHNYIYILEIYWNLFVLTRTYIYAYVDIHIKQMHIQACKYAYIHTYSVVGMHYSSTILYMDSLKHHSRAGKEYSNEDDADHRKYCREEMRRFLCKEHNNNNCDFNCFNSKYLGM